jgi:hypothetical protein
LKPENVLLTAGGTAKLVDFGLARSMASRLTSEGAIAGTAFYLAPEFALGQPFDGRADLYALGVMLYELTTGRLPFVGDDPLAVISQHLHAPVVPPRAKNAEIPPALDALIVRLLSKAPTDRPASASEVLRMLEQPSILDQEAVPAEELSVLERIERGRIVGRERELQEARVLWIQARSGQGRMLLISGEPGVGKTRLVRELVTQVEVSAGRALVGASYAEGGAPYAAFGQIIRQALRSDSDDGFDLPESVLADLLMLAPELRLRYPFDGTQGRPDLPANPPLDGPQAEQHRLFRNLLVFFTALSDRAPLLLVYVGCSQSKITSTSIAPAPRSSGRCPRLRRRFLLELADEGNQDITKAGQNSTQPPLVVAPKPSSQLASLSCPQEFIVALICSQEFIVARLRTARSVVYL